MVTKLRLVPASRVGGVHGQELPQHIGDRVALCPRHCIAYHHVTLADPILPVGLAQYSARHGLVDVLQLHGLAASARVVAMAFRVVGLRLGHRII